MCTTEILNLINQEAKKRGYRCEIRPSSSTSSIYVKLYSGETSLMFRLADHATSYNVLTLRVDKKMSRDQVQRFINNRCTDLSIRFVKETLGIRRLKKYET